MAKTTSLFEKFRETGKHGIVYGLGAIIEKAIAFILLPLYTTKFTASDYGVLGIVTITGAVLTTIFLIGTNSSLLRSYYDHKDEKDKKTVISTAFFMVLVSSILLLILGLIFSNKLSFILFDSPEYQLHFKIIILTAMFNILNAIPFAVFRVKKRSFHFIIFQIVFLATGIGLIIYLVNGREMGILGALIGNLTMAFLNCFALYIYIRKELVLKISRVEIKRMLLFGLPLVPANLSVFVFTAINRYFLNYYRSTHEVGLYSLANNFGTIITVLLATPISLIWPAMYLSVKEHKNAKEFYSRALTYTLTISLFLFLIFSLLAREVLHIFSNEEFWEAYLVIPIIVLTYSLWSVRKIINVAVTLKRKTKGTAIINFTGAGINIGLNFLLIPKYGIMGAAYATLATYIIVIASMFFYNQKLMKLHYEWIRLIKLFLVTAMIFAGGYFINTDSITITLIIKSSIILTFPFILLLFKFFTGGEKEKFKEISINVLVKIKRSIVR